MRRSSFLLVSSLAWAACGGGADPDAGTLDASALPDAATVDAHASGTDAAVLDAPAATDATVLDAPAADATVLDATVLDAETADATTSNDASSTNDAAVPARDILVIGTLDSGPFAAHSFRAFLATQGTVTTMSDVTLDAATLDAYDIVLFGSQTDALTQPERNALAAWLATNGHLIALGGYDDTSDTELQSIVAPLGMTIEEDRTTVASGTATFAPGAVTRGTLSGVPVAGADVVTSFSSATGALEAELPDGLDIGVRWTSTVGSGRAFVWSDDHVTLDVNWNADLQQFWGSVFSFLFP